MLRCLIYKSERHQPVSLEEDAVSESNCIWWCYCALLLLSPESCGGTAVESCEGCVRMAREEMEEPERLKTHVNYAWGQKGDTSLVATLHARNTIDVSDAKKTYAELWIGTHNSAPAKLLHSTGETLTDFIAEHCPVFTIGEHAFEGLPYLLKVLSVGGALSIQAHPNRRLAQKLHEQNPKAYKDDNYKPEMAVALTPFDALCGFRSCDSIIADVTRVPEFAEAAGRVVAEDFVKVIRGDGNRADALKCFFGSLMRQAEDKIKECLEQLVIRLQKMDKDDLTAQDITLQDLYSQYPGDVGCFAAYLMNKLTLNPGEAIYIGANEPHAYLKGECVEIMANSDNVVRAGLTPKFKDVDVLVDMLTYKDGEPEVMHGEQVTEKVKLYQPPIRDFQLECVELAAGESTTLDSTRGPCMLLTVAGEGSVSFAQKAPTAALPLYVGAIYFELPCGPLQITSSGSTPLHLFRSNVNEKMIAATRSGSICTIQ